MVIIQENKTTVDRKYFLLIFAITFTIFIFTSDAHRYTIDEAIANDQAYWFVTQTPPPLYHQGESRVWFDHPDIYPNPTGPICKTYLLCSPANIGYTITEIPFVFLNHNLHVITQNTAVWTTTDFDDALYVHWRNSLNPDFTFMELFYGPIFSALSTSIFYLICRIFNYEQKTSIVVTLFFGLATTVWAYSNTSLNGVPDTFFILLGFYFFIKFRKNNQIANLLFSGIAMGYSFLVRLDAMLVSVVLFGFLLFILKGHDSKIKKIAAFTAPVTFFYFLHFLIDYIGLGVPPFTSGIASISAPLTSITTSMTPVWEGAFGLLLSPGVGLFIYAPILFTVFFSFPDLYKKNRMNCIMLLSIVVLWVIYYSTVIYWHGLVAWGARYLLPIVPFLLLPLGASVEKRKNKTLLCSIIILAAIGAFINIVYVAQDEPWFVWQGTNGLFSLGRIHMALWINPVTIWTFEYSQLTQTIKLAFTNLQPDIFLLKLMGPVIYGISIIVLLTPSSYALIRNFTHIFPKRVAGRH